LHRRSMRSLLPLQRNPKWPRRARRTLRRRPPKRAPRSNVLSLTADEGALEVREQKGPALVVGLGNPGIEYQFTPHNVGFLAIDRLAEQGGLGVTNRRCRALTATTRIAGREVVLAKPETYMNLSGISVQALVKEFDTRDLIVIYDEIALPLGSLRIRERGSSGGHNGVKSVSGALGSEEWLRIRIGVAPPGDEAAERARRGRKDYVLTPMRKAQLTILDQVLDRTAQAVEMVLAKGAGPAMNEFNRREPGDE
jgi:peptidyl-tRNA hydrolase, PTH1 family